MIVATIPGSALRHLGEIVDPEREPECRRFEVLSSRRYGRGSADTVEIVSDSDARAIADRLRGLAEVERDVRAYGDGADSSIERACDLAAERIEKAVSANCSNCEGSGETRRFSGPDDLGPCEGCGGTGSAKAQAQIEEASVALDAQLREAEEGIARQEAEGVFDREVIEAERVEPDPYSGTGGEAI